MMQRRRHPLLVRTILAVCVASSLVLVTPALAQDAQAPSAAVPGGGRPGLGSEIFDAAVLRPLGTIEVIVGSALFVASVPIVAPAVGVGGARDIFVRYPYEYTFERSLGDF